MRKIYFTILLMLAVLVLNSCQTDSSKIRFAESNDVVSSALLVRYIDSTFAILKTVGVIYSPTYNLKLDLYQPTPDAEIYRATIVFTQDDSLQCRYFSGRGYVTATVDYRQSTKKNFAAADILTAVRFLRKRSILYGINSDKIAVAGRGIGAFAVLGAAYDEAAIRANRDYGIYESKVSACAEQSGGLRRYDLIESGEPPMLIIHGTADTVVPFDIALSLRARCDAVGITHYDRFIQNAGHNLSGYQNQINVWMRDFFYQEMILR